MKCTLLLTDFADKFLWFPLSVSDESIHKVYITQARDYRRIFILSLHIITIMAYKYFSN